MFVSQMWVLLATIRNDSRFPHTSHLKSVSAALQVEGRERLGTAAGGCRVPDVVTRTVRGGVRTGRQEGTPG